MDHVVEDEASVVVSVLDFSMAGVVAFVEEVEVWHLFLLARTMALGNEYR